MRRIKMRKKAKVLTKNWAKIDLAFEDIKRCLDSNMEREDKVAMIENILRQLYV